MNCFFKTLNKILQFPFLSLMTYLKCCGLFKTNKLEFLGFKKDIRFERAKHQAKHTYFEQFQMLGNLKTVHPIKKC